MATFASGGRVTVEIVQGEMMRLRSSWSGRNQLASTDPREELDGLMGETEVSKIDLFDRAQLAQVLRVCHASRTLSEAGRRLFDVSRTRKGTANDADRLRKYLARFGLDWARVAQVRS